jgi:hypothetical protein
MKVIMVILLTAWALCSCSIDPTIEYKISPIVQAEVDKFFLEGQKRGIVIPRENLIVTVQAINNDSLMRSHSTTEGCQRVVVINPYHIARFIRGNDSHLIEATVAHELGHALLQLKHTTTEVSLMNYEYTYTSYFKKDCIKDKFYDQLFLRLPINKDSLFYYNIRC